MQSSSVFLAKFEDLVREIIIQNNVPYYRVDSSFESQMNAEGTSNQVAIVRITSYFEDSVTKISEALIKEFDLTVLKSTDRNSNWVDSFASNQVHYLASLKANRLELTEYKRWGAATFEIRISSILQDAWSGMEKELTKGGAASVPDEVKRDFYRIGALLEMADAEFLKIKNLVTKQKGANANQQEVPTTNEVAQPAPIAAKIEPTVAAPNVNFDIFDSLAGDNTNTEHTDTDAERFLELFQSQINTDKEPTYSVTASDFDSLLNQAEKAVPQPETFVLNTVSVDTSNPVAGNTVEGDDLNKSVPSFNEGHAFAPGLLDENAQMTDATLREYILSSKLLREIDSMIAERAGAKVNDEIDIEGDVERLRYLKVFTLKQLHEKLSENKIDIVAFAEKWIGRDNGGSFDSGISLFYLEYLLVGKKNDPAFAVEYVLKFISDNDYSARYIIPTYNSIRQTENSSNFSHLTLK